MPSHNSSIREYLSSQIPTFHPNKSSVVLVVLGNLEVTVADLATGLEEEAEEAEEAKECACEPDNK
jgi:hypothetical protein